MNLDLYFVRQQIEVLRVQYGELEADEETWLLALESETNLHELLRHIERRRQSTTCMAGALAENIAQIELRQKRFEHREKMLRAAAFKLMEAAEVQKLEMAEATYSVRNGRRKVIITDDRMIPDILCKITREPEKKRIGEMLKEGKEVRGAELSNAETYLTISTK